MNFEDLFAGSPDPFASDASSQEAKPKEQNTKLSMGNDKDRAVMWKAAGEQALSDLLQHDPMVRADLLAQAERSKMPSGFPERESLVVYDQAGNIKGVKKNILGGAYATGRDQLEVMRAIRRESHRIHGIKE